MSTKNKQTKDKLAPNFTTIQSSKMVHRMCLNIAFFIVFFNLETSLCQYLTDGIDAGLITPRLDRFGTQRQRRPNQRPRNPSQDSSFDIMNG